MDIPKQVAYWRAGSEEDLVVATELLANRRIWHGMFFLHLSVEKMLKAHVTLATGQVPPKIHNLLTLAKRAGLTLEEPALSLLGDMDRFNLHGRYPDAETPKVSPPEAEEFLRQSTEVLQWLRQRLSR